MHLHMYRDVNCNGSQLTICKKSNAKVFKLLPSAFTYVNILFMNWYYVNKGFIILANIVLEVLGAL
jgi:hypothetical protein